MSPRGSRSSSGTTGGSVPGLGVSGSSGRRRTWRCSRCGGSRAGHCRSYVPGAPSAPYPEGANPTTHPRSQSSRRDFDYRQGWAGRRTGGGAFHRRACRVGTRTSGYTSPSTSDTRCTAGARHCGCTRRTVGHCSTVRPGTTPTHHGTTGWTTGVRCRGRSRTHSCTTPDPPTLPSRPSSEWNRTGKTGRRLSTVLGG